MTGQDDLGYSMLYRAIDIAEKMGYTGGEGQDIDLSDKSKELYNSTIKAIWGLFQVDTSVFNPPENREKITFSENNTTLFRVAHTGFLKPCRIKNVRLTRFPDLSLDKDTDIWVPYPSQKAPRNTFGVTYFNQSCALSEIARDISISLFTDKFDDDKKELSEAFGSLYKRIKDWHDNLPAEFDMANKPAPHILLLQYVSLPLFTLDVYFQRLKN